MVYPDAGETVTRNVTEPSHDGNCTYDQDTIEIRGCDGYFVHYLKPVTGLQYFMDVSALHYMI